MQKALEAEQEKVEAVTWAILTDKELAEVKIFTSPEYITRKIEAVRARAEESGDLSAELRALELLGRSQGLFVERKVTTSTTSDWDDLLERARLYAEKQNSQARIGPPNTQNQQRVGNAHGDQAVR